MPAVFPSVEWLQEFENKLNSDERYAQIAKNWEGDMYFIIEPEGNLKVQTVIDLDLWQLPNSRARSGLEKSAG